MAQHESTLSVHRAFVVHLDEHDGGRRRRFRGRVEHLSSGETARFSSLRDLLAFFDATRDRAASTAPRRSDASSTDGPERAPPPLRRTARP